MTFSHEQANERLIDLVYGEVEGAERAALEAHVAGCERCQGELAALAGTRAKVRAALVEAPVPGGAHARILRAAAEAMAPAASLAVARAASLAASPAPVRDARPAEAPSIWRRLRAGWTLPTFATVGAFAILLLASRVFLNPQRTYERGQEGIIPRAEPSAPPPADNVPAEARRADEPAKVAEPTIDLRDDLRVRNVGIARRHAIEEALEKSMPSRERKPKRDVDEGGPAGLLEGARSTEGFGEGSGAGIGRGGLGTLGHGAGGDALGSRSVGGIAGAAKASAPKVVVAPRKEEAPAPSGAFASPPTGWKGGASAGAPTSPSAAVAPASARAKRSQDDELDRLSAGKADKAVADDGEMEEAPAPGRKAEARAASAPVAEKKKAAPPSAAPPPPARPAAAPVAEAQAPARESAPAEKMKDTSDAKERDGGPTQEALAKRAEQLFAARKWNEAIAAYRELLRRFPDADPATKWRARVAEAQGEVAAQAARAAKKAAPAAASAPAEAQ